MREEELSKHTRGILGSRGNTEGWKTGRRKHGLLSAHICNLSICLSISRYMDRKGQGLIFHYFL